MSSGAAKPELVKLYYRIGEVSQLVGVQPHVLRYWETEFRTIRPQKSSKGQRVYSRRDVEKLLRVKDLLRNQGFTIAGARKRLRELAKSGDAVPTGSSSGSSTAAALTSQASASAQANASSQSAAVRTLALRDSAADSASSAPSPLSLAPAQGFVTDAEAGRSGAAGTSAGQGPAPGGLSLASPLSVGASASSARSAPGNGASVVGSPALAGRDRSAKQLRRALVDLRGELARMLGELSAE